MNKDLLSLVLCVCFYGKHLFFLDTFSRPSCFTPSLHDM